MTTSFNFYGNAPPRGSILVSTNYSKMAMHVETWDGELGVWI